MKYYFRKFKVICGVGGDLLLGPSCNVRVVNHDMVQFLRNAQNWDAGIFQGSDIASLLTEANINFNQGIEFLKETGILEELSEEEPSPFRDAVLVNDNMEKIKPLAEAMISDGVNLRAVFPVDEIPENLSAKKTLFIVFMENYSKEVIRNLYVNYSDQEGVGFIQSYFYQREFRIDGLFIPSVGTPCHFCHFQRLHEREEYSFSDSPYSWHRLVKLLEQSDQKIPSILPLLGTDISYATHILRRKIQHIIGVPVSREHLDSFISSVYADLVSCTTHSEPISHWHSCDCIRGSF